MGGCGEIRFTDSKADNFPALRFEFSRFGINGKGGRGPDARKTIRDMHKYSLQQSGIMK
jgi:hypothetical protein